MERKDTYVVISIQDTPTPGAALFNDEMAEQIIVFINSHKDVDTLLVHCYAGQSRSRAVGAFAVKMLGGDNFRYFKGAIPNQHVYDILEAAWIRHVLQENMEENNDD